MMLEAQLRLRRPSAPVWAVLAVAVALPVLGTGCRRAVLGVCAETETRCNGDAVQTCSDGDWSAPVACGAGESCSLGACSMASACVPDCTTAGTTFCAGGSVVSCGEHDSDACLDLGMPVACEAGQFCSNGACAASCTDECAMGTTGCAGPGAYQDCGNFDEDDCLDWTSAMACPAGNTCAAGSGGVGSCLPADCGDECTPVDFSWTCAGGGFTDCLANGDADPCLEVTVVPCTVCNGTNPPIQCLECCG